MLICSHRNIFVSYRDDFRIVQARASGNSEDWTELIEARHFYVIVISIHIYTTRNRLIDNRG